MPAEIIVVAAILRDENGRILCALRNPVGSRPNLWEFPGGKLEPGETATQALQRELMEELGCTVETTGDIFVESCHAYEDISIRLLAMPCTLQSGQPRPLEHSALLWLPAAALASLVWAPADLPIVSKLLQEAVPEDSSRQA
ncbi:MAG: (deoxy)nucleoside triphosphate pyrophosphohydrolase [Spirochaetes bacterium]|nr:(deoxy)nucleoside triphosphate pyrophosphohydrolase [Spirochaetota bacterium]MBU0954970.1 (deoxy)nucleoside triphosphate pyrophosphohydrolase [Spirochaetota bacterium]